MVQHVSGWSWTLACRHVANPTAQKFSIKSSATSRISTTWAVSSAAYYPNDHPTPQRIPSCHGSEISSHPGHYGDLAVAPTHPPAIRGSRRRVERMAQVVRPIYARVAARIRQMRLRAPCRPCIPRCIPRFVLSNATSYESMLTMRFSRRNLAHQHRPHGPVLRDRRIYGP